MPTIYRTYALAYPYYSPPLLFSYSQYEVPTTRTPDAPAGGSITPAFVKHHQPDHKGEGSDAGDDSEVGSSTDANMANSNNNNNYVDGGMEGHKNILKLVYPLR